MAENLNIAATACPIVWNASGKISAPWTDAQDAILSDTGFKRASAAIKAWPNYAATPLAALTALAETFGIGGLFYKDEGGRFGLGSFKALGGAYAVERLIAEAKRAGRAPGDITVCCATDGNHGRSVAWGAAMFGCHCVIFIHANVSEARGAAIAAYGADVRRTPGNYDDSVRIAGEIAAREGWYVVSDTSYPGYMDVPKDVMQGYEIMAEEAFAQMDQPPTHIFLQTGVGGMAAAVAASAKRRWGDDRPRIILADPDRAACWVESFRAGEPVAVHGDLDTMMAGLACGEVSLLAWEILRDHANAAILVEDTAAAAMMRRLAAPIGSDPAIAAGESATAGLVALASAIADPATRTALKLDADSRVLVFGSEGDTDPELYHSIVGDTAAAVRAKTRGFSA